MGARRHTGDRRPDLHPHRERIGGQEGQNERCRGAWWQPCPPRHRASGSRVSVGLVRVNGETDRFGLTILYGQHESRRSRPVPGVAGTTDDDLRKLAAREVDQGGRPTVVYRVTLRHLDAYVDRSRHRCLLRIGETQ